MRVAIAGAMRARKRCSHWSWQPRAVRPAARVTLSLPAVDENALYDWAASEGVGAGIALNVSVDDAGRVVLELDYALDEGETLETVDDTLIIVLKPLAEEEIGAQA